MSWDIFLQRIDETPIDLAKLRKLISARYPQLETDRDDWWILDTQIMTLEIYAVDPKQIWFGVHMLADDTTVHTEFYTLFNELTRALECGLFDTSSADWLIKPPGWTPDLPPIWPPDEPPAEEEPPKKPKKKGLLAWLGLKK